MTAGEVKSLGFPGSSLRNSNPRHIQILSWEPDGLFDIVGYRKGAVIRRFGVSKGERCGSLRSCPLRYVLALQWPRIPRRRPNIMNGNVAERLNALSWKGRGLQGLAGSNPAISASNIHFSQKHSCTTTADSSVGHPSAMGAGSGRPTAGQVFHLQKTRCAISTPVDHQEMRILAGWGRGHSAGLITRRSLVRIRPLLPTSIPGRGSDDPPAVK